VAEWRGKGIPAPLAADLAALPLLDGAPDIVETAQARKAAVAEVTRAYFVLSDALHLSWLYDQIESLPVDSRWSALARGSLRDELATQQRALVGQILAEGGRKPAESKVAAWIGRDDSSLRFTLAMLSELASQKSLDYPTVSVAVRRLAQLAASG
jgi:glutamate dehydrogenase